MFPGEPSRLCPTTLRTKVQLGTLATPYNSVPDAMSIGHLLTRAALRHPDRPAWHQGDTTIPYREAERRVNGPHGARSPLEDAGHAGFQAQRLAAFDLDGRAARDDDEQLVLLDVVAHAGRVLPDAANDAPLLEEHEPRDLRVALDDLRGIERIGLQDEVHHSDGARCHRVQTPLR